MSRACELLLLPPLLLLLLQCEGGAAVALQGVPLRWAWGGGRFAGVGGRGRRPWD